MAQRKRKAPHSFHTVGAHVKRDVHSIPHYDMVRDDPEQWESTCRGLAAILAATMAFILGCEMGWLPW